MRRREFISLLGGAAAAWPLAARAQQNDRARWIGILMAFTESDAEIQARVTAFRQELRKLGWAEGSNLRIEERWPADNMDRVRSDAAELVELKPDAILVEAE
jgi:putative ABC transport system substrate-binding protein